MGSVLGGKDSEGAIVVSETHYLRFRTRLIVPEALARRTQIVSDQNGTRRPREQLASALVYGPSERKYPSY